VVGAHVVRLIDPTHAPSVYLSVHLSIQFVSFFNHKDSMIRLFCCYVNALIIFFFRLFLLDENMELRLNKQYSDTCPKNDIISYVPQV